MQSIVLTDCHNRVFTTTANKFDLTNAQLRVMLCALGNEKGPCKGDSGGPYTYINNNQHVLVINWLTSYTCFRFFTLFALIRLVSLVGRSLVRTTACLLYTSPSPRD